MSNEQLIWNKRIELMNAGIIGKSGNRLVKNGENGKKELIDEPELIHTAREWKRRGYRVMRQQQPVSKLDIFKFTGKTKDGKKEYKTIEALFFAASQVEAIADI
ncbi:hypothetical protein [Butyrivibrio sp. VCB2006]|uniref:hypothetical protein n=1 Tax=Butyrivibrio sp. VCB2006 TaxID=1280679 RepID=UPI0004926493|nr:hypothetical protein [Butyrivibrio sp. VCB2006]